MTDRPDTLEDGLDQLNDEEVKIAAEALSAALSRTQRDYDSFVRTIAAAAVALTASLVTAFGGAGWSGGFAVGSCLLALAATLVSFWTATADIQRRQERNWEHDRAGVHGGHWKTATTILNAGAGGLLILGGILLLVFILTTRPTN